MQLHRLDRLKAGPGLIPIEKLKKNSEKRKGQAQWKMSA